MTITIREATSSDLTDIMSFAASDRDDQFKYFASKNPTLTFAAVDDSGQPLGFITSWQNLVHPHHQNIRIVLSPKKLPTSAVIDALVKREQQQLDTLGITLPLIVMYWEPQTRKTVYFEKHGYHIFRKTWMPDLLLDNIPSTNTHLPDDVVTLRDVWAKPAQKKAAISLLRQQYEIVHQDNPAAHLSIENWAKNIDGELPYLDWSLATVVDGDFKALSFVFPGDAESSLDVGWLTDVDNDAHHVIELLNIQCQLFKQTQLRSIFGELDSTDPVAMQVKAKFPWEPAPAWISLIK
ncbi:MAG TPA: hypothetical protein DCW31_05295 [Lactobacillus sp.]|nr:hypothetical protein [Lactobacillus sp.]